MSSDDDKLDEMFSKLNLDLVSEQEKNMLILIALEELAVDNEGYRNKRNAIIHGLEDGKSLKELIGKNVDKDKEKILKDHIKEKYNKQLVFFFFIRYLEFNRELFFGNHLDEIDPDYTSNDHKSRALDLANKIGKILGTVSLDELKKKKSASK